MIQTASNADYSEIIRVWELSVRETHDFLPEDYLQELKTLLPAILPQIPDLFVWKTTNGSIAGFTGVVNKKVEVLFIHPAKRGQGIGKKMMDFCINELHADKVDVNEQNTQAIGFYQRLGFEQVGYQEKDALNRNFPILLMELRHTNETPVHTTAHK
jgi:putative acetyltransferase